MKLSSRISLLVIALVLLSGVLIMIFYDRLLHDVLSESERLWVETLDDSLSEPLSLSVINNKPLEVTEILSRLVRRQPSLEYAYVIGFDGELFAHTFAGGLPRAFSEQDHATHRQDVGQSLYRDVRRGRIQDFSVPLIEGMNAHLHLGVNDTVIDSIRTRSRWQLLLIILGVSLLGLMVVIPTGRRISRPLEQLVSLVNDYARGKKVDFRRIPRADAEIHALLNAMRRMTTERDRAMDALARREQYLALTLDSIGDGVIATDAEGQVTRINGIARKLTGWSEAEAMGRPLPEIFNIVNAHTRKRVDNPVEKVLEHGEIVGLANHTVLIARDGSEYQIADSGSPIKDEQGRILGVILVFRDVTGEYRLQEEIRQSRDRLEEAVTTRTRELESFSYSVSHDLRSPLRSINGFSHALLEDYADKLDDEGRDYLQRIYQASIRMGQLIDGLLSLSKINRGELNIRDVDLSQLARNAMQRLSESDPQRKVEFHIQADMHVRGDPAMLMIMLDNLLGNAWKYTAKTPQPRVEFFTTDIDGQKVYVIRDNGAGFNMKYADKLFGAFQRLHSSDYEGMGIGLATVQRIVQRHGGRVWAEAEVGKGASLFFTLGAL